jgi:hypothetical protein
MEYRNSWKTYLTELNGRWADVLPELCGLPRELFDGKGHPCPNCGGTDRFSFTDIEGNGSVHCRGCTPKAGNGISAIAFINGVTFSQSCTAVEGFLRDGTVTGLPSMPMPVKAKAEPKPKKEDPSKGKKTLTDLFGRDFILYLYPDANGEPVAAAARRDLGDGKKTFRQAKWLPDHGVWIQKGMAEGCPLFKSPALFADKSSGPLAEDFIIVVEGEKCAEACIELGFLCTTSIGGSSAAHKTDWSLLGDRHVVIIPDCDEPGAKYAQKVADLCVSSGSLSVKIVNLDGPTGYDIADWIMDGGTQDQLERMILGTDEHDPFGASGTLSISQEHKHMRDVIIEDIAREGETVNIIAAAKTGKSWMSLDLGMSVALGERWMGEFKCYEGKVLLVDNELHPETIASRIRSVCTARQRDEVALGRNMFIKTLRGDQMDLPSLLREMTEKIKPGKYQVVILDALYRFIPQGVSENDNAAMMSMYNMIDAAAKKLRCAFFVVHHASKGSQSDKNIVDVGAGAGSIARAADGHLIIRPHETEGLAVLDKAARSFAPGDPLSIKFDFPLWNVVKEVEPELKSGKKKAESKVADENAEVLIQAKTIFGSGEFDQSKLRTETGRSKRVCERVMDYGISEGKLEFVRMREGHRGSEVAVYRFRSEWNG